MTLTSTPLKAYTRFLCTVTPLTHTFKQQSEYTKYRVYRFIHRKPPERTGAVIALHVPRAGSPHDIRWSVTSFHWLPALKYRGTTKVPSIESSLHLSSHLTSFKILLVLSHNSPLFLNPLFCVVHSICRLLSPSPRAESGERERRRLSRTCRARHPHLNTGALPAALIRNMEALTAVLGRRLALRSLPEGHR